METICHLSSGGKCRANHPGQVGLAIWFGEQQHAGVEMTGAALQCCIAEINSHRRAVAFFAVSPDMSIGLLDESLAGTTVR
jgi:hypothetical protein